MILHPPSVALNDLRQGGYVVAIGGEFNRPTMYPPTALCTARVRRLSTGEMLERFTVDCRELLATGEYVRA